MWCIALSCCRGDDETKEEKVDVSMEQNVDPFSDDDFTQFFLEDVNTTRDTEGNYRFALAEHKLLDVQNMELEMSIVNSDIKLLGGGDEPQTTRTQEQTSVAEIGTKENLKAILEKVKLYSSTEQFDLKIPGLRHDQVVQLTRLKSLYLRKLKFYLDEDSYFMRNWEVAVMRHNEKIVNKVGNFRSKEKVDIVILTLHTDFLRLALELVKDIKVSVGIETDNESTSSPGLDLSGIYEINELTGSGPRLVKNIALSLFSSDARERAENKLELVLQRHAHKHFSADRICQTMLRICKAGNLTSEEFHCFMRHLRDHNIPTCPCGQKGSIQEAWLSHQCAYEAWMIRIGIANVVGGYLKFTSFDWPIIITNSEQSLGGSV